MTGYSVLRPNAMLSQTIAQQFPPGYIGHGIDIGASDGNTCNTTLWLEREFRWNILCVEPNPVYEPLLRAERRFVEVCACDAKPGEDIVFKVHDANPEAFSSLRPKWHPRVHPKEGESWSTLRVRVCTVDQLLHRWEFPRLDLLAIDTEGTELDVLKGCDLTRWQPKVIVVESWDEEGELDPYLTERGYHKIHRTVDNHVWARRHR